MANTKNLELIQIKNPRKKKTRAFLVQQNSMQQGQLTPTH